MSTQVPLMRNVTAAVKESASFASVNIGGLRVAPTVTQVILAEGVSVISRDAFAVVVPRAGNVAVDSHDELPSRRRLRDASELTRSDVAVLVQAPKGFTTRRRM